MTECDMTQSMTSNAVEKFHKEGFSKDSTNINSYDASHWSCSAKSSGVEKRCKSALVIAKILIKGHDPCEFTILTTLAELVSKGAFPAISWLIFWLNISEAPKMDHIGNLHIFWYK